MAYLHERSPGFGDGEESWPKRKSIVLDQEVHIRGEAPSTFNDHKAFVSRGTSFSYAEFGEDCIKHILIGALPQHFSQSIQRSL